MKNYLFRPFEDDDNKINAFSELKDILRYYIDDINLVLNPLIMFVGQLESYYDCMLNDLQLESIEQIKDNKELQAEIDKLNTECWCGCNDDLKAEYMELKAELKQVKADAKHDADVCYELDDKHIKIIKDLENAKCNPPKS